MIDSRQTIADVVLDHSECAEALHRYHIDLCRHGELSLEAAAREAEVDLQGVLESLSRAITARRDRSRRNPRNLPTPQLLEHIVTSHHRSLRQVLPFLAELAVGLSGRHAGEKPELVTLADAVTDLGAILLPHIDEEERELFPVLAGEPIDASAVDELRSAMQREHEAVARLLGRIREATDDFTLRAGACVRERTLFAELWQLEGDLFAHLHLETRVLLRRFGPP